MELVFNEWLVEYMAPGSSHDRLVWEILDLIEARGDTVVVRRESPFMKKFYRFSKEHERLSLPVFKRFHLLLRDSKRVRIVEEEEISELPPSLAEVIPEDDLYLATLAATTGDRTIVTTDTALRDRLEGKEGFRVYLLEDFIRHYRVGKPA